MRMKGEESYAERQKANEKERRPRTSHNTNIFMNAFRSSKQLQSLVYELGSFDMKNEE